MMLAAVAEMEHRLLTERARTGLVRVKVEGKALGEHDRSGQYAGLSPYRYYAGGVSLRQFNKVFFPPCAPLRGRVL